MDLYSLTAPNQTAKIITSASVPNIAIRAFWNYVEASEGSYNFSAIDGAIAQLPSGAKFSLSVSAGKNTPAWVYAAGAQSFIYQVSELQANRMRFLGMYGAAGASAEIPVPWDAIYLSKWQAMIDALAAKYAGNSQLDHVVIGIQSIDQETTLPHSATDDANWLKIGYTNRLIESAWGSMIGYASLAFPGKKLCMDYVPGAMPFGPPDEGIVLMRKLAALMGANGIAQNNGLSASWIDHDILTINCEKAYQMISAVGPSVVTAISHANASGASYVEVYPMDVGYIS